MRKYVNSGKFNIVPVLLWTVIGLVAGAALSVAYTFIAHFNPLMYLNFIVLGLMVFALTGVVVAIVKQSKCRNRAVTLTVTFLICLFAWYAGWCAILAHLLEVHFFKFLLRPVMTFDAMLYYSDNMEWTIDKTVVSPGMLKVAYAIELLAYFIPMYLVSRQKLYYCEFCEGFLKEKDHYIAETSIVDEHLEAIRQGDLSLLEQVQLLDKPDQIVDEQYKLDLHRCEGCGERIFNLYRLKMKHKKGKKAEIARTTAVVEDIYAARPVRESL
jgi:hypothetical protein